LTSFLAWYNDHRPHMRLGGRTPNEVYFGQHPANRRPRIEPLQTLATPLALCPTADARGWTTR
jgi:hypothetical protein